MLVSRHNAMHLSADPPLLATSAAQGSKQMYRLCWSMHVTHCSLLQVLHLHQLDLLQ